MPIDKNPYSADNRALMALVDYKPHNLIVTAGVEVFYNKISTVYGFLDYGKKLDMRVDVDFFKGGLRKNNNYGTYCMNLYYGSYISRDCVVDQNDWCACKRGKSSMQICDP